MAVAARRLRLVHSRRPILTVDQLAHFSAPKTWPEILTIVPPMTRSQWQIAIVDADECGFGLLRWTGRTKTERGTWQLTLKGRVYVARRKDNAMGDFRIEVNAVGGHGCQRDIGDGGSVSGCGHMNCPDCLTAEYVAKLHRSGAMINNASLTHWPGQPSEVKDRFVVDRGSGNRASRIRSGSF